MDAMGKSTRLVDVGRRDSVRNAVERRANLIETMKNHSFMREKSAILSTYSDASAELYHVEPQCLVQQ